jgi:Skp family chaperone for outer membrane proteins
MNKILLLLKLIIFLSITPVFAQNKVGFVNVDSVYEKVGFQKNNETYIKNLSTFYIEKDSIMISKFVKEANDFLKEYHNICYHTEKIENKKIELAQEQKRLQAFDSAVAKLPFILENHLKKWSYDYIKKEIRLFGQINGYDISLNHENIQNNSEPKALKIPNRNANEILSNSTASSLVVQSEELTNNTILHIQENNSWKVALKDYREFITEKILFDVGLK